MRAKRIILGLVGLLCYLAGTPLFAAQETLEGELIATVEDYFKPGTPGGYSIERNFLQVGDERIELELPADQKIQLRTKTRLRVKGQRTRNKIRLNSNRPADLQILKLSDGSTPPSVMAFKPNESGTLVDPIEVAALTGARKVAVLLVNFPNNVTQPWTPQQIRDQMFSNVSPSINHFYQESSYGQMSITGDVFGWYTLPSNPTPMADYGCYYPQIETEARQAAAAAGVNLGAYNHVMMIFPYTGQCSWAGLAYTPGNNSWINGYLDRVVIAHELGHNFGLSHANGAGCPGVPYNPTPKPNPGYCEDLNHVDEHDMMGYSWGPTGMGWDLNAMYKNFLAWLTPTTVTTSGIYTINPIESAGSAVKALKINRTSGGNSYSYFLEYRQALGPDSLMTNPNVLNGVLFHTPVSGSSSLSRSWAIPLGGSFTNPALEVGQTYTDTFSNVSFTVLDRTASQIRVSINFGSTPDTTAPTVSITAPANGATVTGNRNITASASDNIGVSRVDYYLDGGAAPIGTATASPYTYSWNTTLAANGPHTLTAKAYDAANNEGTSAAVNVTVSNVPQVPQVVLTKTSNITSVATGFPVTFTIQYQNTGTANAADVTITDIIPAGSALVAGSITSPPGVNASVSGNTITWQVGAVNAGAAVKSVSFQVMAL